MSNSEFFVSRRDAEWPSGKDPEWLFLLVAYLALVRALIYEDALDAEVLVFNLRGAEVVLRNSGEADAAELAAWLVEHLTGMPLH